MIRNRRGQEEPRQCTTLLVICVVALMLSCENKACVSAAEGTTKRVIHVGGLFPLCCGWFNNLGNQTLQAALLAVRQVNEDPNILPDYEMQLDYNNTMASTGQAINIIFDYFQTKPAKIAVIGDLFSSPSVYSAEITSLWEVIQITYGATTPFLTNRKKFPYLFRTMASADAFSNSFIEMMKAFGWRRVATLHSTTEPFPSEARSGDQFRIEGMRFGVQVNAKLTESLKLNNMTIVTGESFTGNPSKVLPVIKRKDARIIFGNFYESTAKIVFCEAYKLGLYGPSYVWVLPSYYTPGWWRHGATDTTCTIEEIREAIEGYMTIGWSMMNQNESAITVSGMTPLQFRTTLNDMFGENIWPSGHQVPTANAYDAVWALALALHETASAILPATLDQYEYATGNISQTLYNAMVELSFMGVSGPVTFQDHGDSSGTFIVEQSKNTSERTIGTYDARRNEIQWLETNTSIWYRRDGEPPPDADDTVIVERVVEIQSLVFIIFVVLASLGIVSALGFLAFNVYFRKLRVIKMSSPNLNNMIIIGCVVAYISVIVSGLTSSMIGLKNFNTYCQASPWVLCLGFTLAFGAMFAKTWRVYSIFTNKNLKRKTIKDWSLFLMVATIACVDTIILCVQQGVDPLLLSKLYLPEEVYTEQRLIVRPVLLVCVNKYNTYWRLAIYVWKGLLLIFGIFITWQTRKVQYSGLNDSKYIGTCIYNVVIFSIIGAPLSYLLATNVTSAYIIISGFIMFTTTLTICVLFVPKVVSVYRGDSGKEKITTTTGGEGTSSHNGLTVTHTGNKVEPSTEDKPSE